MNISVIAMFVMPMSDGSGRCIGDDSFGDDHVSGDDISDEDISDCCIVIPISDGSGRCINGGFFGDDHVSDVESVMKVSLIAIRDAYQ